VTLYTRDKEVYVLSVPSGYVKVGISDSVERRIKEIQAYCYEPVKYECATMRSDGSPVTAAMLEHMVHMKLKQYAGERREWFKTTPEIAVNVLLTTHWFLAIPPDHPDIERVHPNWECHLKKIDAKSTANT
jgi:hypothetical protein